MTISLTSLEIALLILTIEFALIAVVILFRSYRSARQSEVQVASDATALVKRVSDAQESRRLALGTVFKEKYQYDGDELTQTVDEFMQRERVFYNAVANIFLGQGDKKLSDLNGELIKVIAPWISITPKNMVDSSEVESLSADNSRLESELQEAQKVLEDMIEEYNRTFHDEPGEKASTEAAAQGDSEEQAADDEVSGEEWDTAEDVEDDESGEPVESAADGIAESQAAEVAADDATDDNDVDSAEPVEPDESPEQDETAEATENAEEKSKN